MILREIFMKLCSYYYKFKIEKKAAKSGSDLYVGGKSFVTSKTYLGKGVCFNGMGILGNGKVTIGNYFHSGTGCQIITSFHNYEGNAIPYDDTYIDKEVKISDFVWLGNNVIILGGVKIGEGAIIQAGSVVCNDIPDLAIAGGHPAVAFKFRDKKHFYSIKEKGRYH